jgi:hypothetical protein
MALPAARTDNVLRNKVDTDYQELCLQLLKRALCKDCHMITEPYFFGVQAGSLQEPW